MITILVVSKRNDAEEYSNEIVFPSTWIRHNIGRVENIIDSYDNCLIQIEEFQLGIKDPITIWHSSNEFLNSIKNTKYFSGEENEINI